MKEECAKHKIPVIHGDAGSIQSTVDLLAMPNAEGIDFEPPILPGKLFKPADLS